MIKKLTQAQNIRDYFTKNPDKTVSEVAKAMGVTYQVAYMTKRKMEQEPPKQKWETVHISASDTSIEKEMPVTMHEPESDPVNHPAHYKVGGIETIDFIEAKKLNYNMGNAVKYIARADHKGTRKQDIEKAIWYLKRELNHST
jgi:hypothetical protein